MGHLGWGGGWGGEHGKNLTQDAESHHPKHPTQGPLSGPLPSLRSRASGPVQSGGLQPSGVLTTGRVTLGQLPAVLIPHDSQSLAVPTSLITCFCHKGMREKAVSTGQDGAFL